MAKSVVKSRSRSAITLAVAEKYRSRTLPLVIAS